MKRGNVINQDIHAIEEEFGFIEKKLWRLVFHFPYKKLLFLLVLSIIAYIIFRNPNVDSFVTSLGKFEYLGVFIGGLLFTFGFTTPFAVGFFVILNPINPFIVAIIGGTGALLGDLLIFSFIRFNFLDEFQRLEKTAIIKRIRNEIDIYLSHRVRLYILYALAGFILASPLPDEAGVIMLAGLTHIKTRNLIIISFIFNSLGILAMCLI